MASTGFAQHSPEWSRANEKSYRRAARGKRAFFAGLSPTFQKDFFLI